MTTPPGWYADPARRHQYRYWNGQLWTDHVSGPHGTGTAPLPPAPQHQVQPAQRQVQPAQRQAQRSSAHGGLATADPFREPTLSLLRFDHGETVQLQYVTPSGQVVIDAIEEAKPEQDIENDSIEELTRKQRTTTMQVTNLATGALIARVAHYKPIKSSFTVTGPAGEVLLTGKQANVFGAVRYEFADARENPVGTLRADGTRAKHFDVEAPNGAVLARLDKHGSYDTALSHQEAQRMRPVVTPGQGLGEKAVEAMTDQTRDRVRFVVNRPQPIDHPPLALLTMISAMVVELSLSVL